MKLNPISDAAYYSTITGYSGVTGYSRNILQISRTGVSCIIYQHQHYSFTLHLTYTNIFPLFTSWKIEAKVKALDAPQAKGKTSDQIYNLFPPECNI